MEKQLRVLQEAYKTHLSNIRMASRNSDDVNILHRCLQTHEIFERTVTASFRLMQMELMSTNLQLQTLIVKAISESDTMLLDTTTQIYVPLPASIPPRSVTTWETPPLPE